MKSKIFSSVICSAILASILSLSALEQQETQIYLSEIELQEIFSNPKRSYVYVGKETSDIQQVIAEISKLDDNKESAVWGLANHIEKGFGIGNYDAVAQALEQAELILRNHADSLDTEKAAELSRSLNNIIDQVIEDRLSLDAELLSFLKDKVDAPESDMTRSGLRLLVVNEKMHVHGKSKFYRDVTFTHDVKIKKDLRVEGTLSVTDQTIGTNLNLSNSIDATVGNITKDGIAFIHNFGTDNTFVGDSSGNFTLTGIGNSGFGDNTLSALTSGSENTAVGLSALTANTQGNNNIGIGTNAGINYTLTESNNISIGNDGVNGENDTIRIGTTQTATYIAGINATMTGGAAVGVVVDGNGQLGTISSSERMKHNIQNMDADSAPLYALRPVTFAYNGDASEKKQYGLIAEEVASVLPEIVVYDAQGQPKTIQYHVLPALMLNELQKLAARVAILENRS